MYERPRFEAKVQVNFQFYPDKFMHFWHKVVCSTFIIVIWYRLRLNRYNFRFFLPMPPNQLFFHGNNKTKYPKQQKTLFLSSHLSHKLKFSNIIAIPCRMKELWKWNPIYKGFKKITCKVNFLEKPFVWWNKCLVKIFPFPFFVV